MLDVSDNNSDNESDKTFDRFSLKRAHTKVDEFMPLSKSNVFEANDDNYDWGFKKNAKKARIDVKSTETKNKSTDAFKDSIKRHDVYKADDPTKFNDEDKQIFMDNLDAIYKRNLVYIPSFYEIEDTISNTNALVQQSILSVFESEAKRLKSVCENLWSPLYEKYVVTKRLSPECSAYKIIAKGLEQYSIAISVFESCITDFAANAANYIEVVNQWNAKDVDGLTNIFKEAVGVVLLKHKENVKLPWPEMAKETNALVFLRMVNDDVIVMKKRVEKLKKSNKVVEEEEKKDAENELDLDDGGKPENRPVSDAVMKNKGIVPRRKKTNKNPRLKHRMKFKKAVVKHHSQVPRQRNDVGNYEGEASGIKIGIIKSRKFK